MTHLDGDEIPKSWLIYQNVVRTKGQNFSGDLMLNSGHSDREDVDQKQVVDLENLSAWY